MTLKIYAITMVLLVLSHLTEKVLNTNNIPGDLQLQTPCCRNETKNQITCNTSQDYVDISSFNFNPRSVSIGDTPCLVLKMFRETGLVQYFNISEPVLYRFILRVKDGYRIVPYHDWFHGLAVFHFSFAVLQNCQLIKKHQVTPLEGLALLTSALSHDVDHPGTNNQFQLEANTSLAQEYGQLGSILERHHIATTLGFLKSSTETNFMAHIDEEDVKYFHDLISQIILATDLSMHFKQLSKERLMALEGFDGKNQYHRELMRSVIITCADLSDPIKKWPMERLVKRQLYMEFFNQGDREKQLGFEPMKTMDRNTTKIPQSSVEFLSRVTIPIFKILHSLQPETKVCVDNIQQNLQLWNLTITYLEEEERKGRDQLDILIDSKLDNI